MVGGWRGVMAAALAALAAAAAYRSDAFWCGARALPLGVAVSAFFDPRGDFSHELIADLSGRVGSQ